MIIHRTAWNYMKIERPKPLHDIMRNFCLYYKNILIECRHAVCRSPSDLMQILDAPNYNIIRRSIIQSSHFSQTHNF